MFFKKDIFQNKLALTRDNFRSRYCKKIMELHKGEIYLTSEGAEGNNCSLCFSK